MLRSRGFRRMMKFTEETLIPFSLVIAILVGVGSFFRVAYQGEANARAIERVEKKSDLVQDIRTDIEVIKTKVSQIEKTNAQIERSLNQEDK